MLSNSRPRFGRFDYRFLALNAQAAEKSLHPCHSERSEESPQLLFQRTAEILRRLRLLGMTAYRVFPNLLVLKREDNHNYYGNNQ